MKNLQALPVAAALCALCAFPAGGAAAEWENPLANGENRLEAHTFMAPLASAAAALDSALEPPTPFVESLDGKWRFFWTGTPDAAPDGFWRKDFDDSQWFSIDVPSCVELKGWGVPVYTNAKIPFATNDPPRVNAAYNPVSNYRREFSVPAEWRGRRVILRFEGASSAMRVWVNGRGIGYSEDSRVPAEFDVTGALDFSAGARNLLAVRVWRWCDGSYLENQDMFRLSGLFRSVLLYAEPAEGAIRDCTVSTEPAGGGAWRIALGVKGGNGWTASLHDACGRAVAEMSEASGGAAVVKDAETWSAERPYLYTLVLNGGSGDIRRLRVGFRKFEIRGAEIFLNGAKIRFRGVNRHETHPERGYSLTEEDMLRDAFMIKRCNIDSVRTSHYPCHRLWYDICDRYGLYVMAEANVESGFNAPSATNTVAFFPEWTQAIRERNVRHALNFRNNPCVLVWSLGNESGAGPDFVPAAEAMRMLDPSRPLHYVDLPEVSDFECMMYPDVKVMERLLDKPADKPVVLTEYAHAMGNGLGNFKEYWDTFLRDARFCGGFVWDWADQAVWKHDGRGCYLAYGGDFDEEVNDGPFCLNGIVTADRRETAKSIEVRHVQRPLAVSRAGEEFVLENRLAFTFADAFDGRWEVLEDGRAVAGGALTVPHLAPGGRAALDIPPCGGPGERFVNFEFSLKDARPWAGKGYVVARDQVPLGGKFRAARPLPPTRRSAVAVSSSAENVILSAGGTRAKFERATGTLSLLEMDGRTVLRDAPGTVAGPRLTVMRALTDNDVWLRNVYWSSKNRDFLYENGVAQLRYHARDFEVSAADDGAARLVSRVRVTTAKSGGFEHVAEWTLSRDGVLRMENTAVPFGHLPQLPRLGLSWTLDPALENFEWYGRGPGENYVDRKSASFMGLWRSTVSEQFEDYVRPQDCGSRTDVRRAALTGGDGRGVEFSSAEPFIVQALHYTWEDLEFARHRRGQQRFRAPLVPRREVFLNTDVRQLGLGGASCGTEPLEAYRFPNAPARWTLELRPARR